MRWGGWRLRFAHRCTGLPGLTYEAERLEVQFVVQGLGNKKSPPTSLSRARCL